MAIDLNYFIIYCIMICYYSFLDFKEQPLCLLEFSGSVIHSLSTVNTFLEFLNGVHISCVNIRIRIRVQLYIHAHLYRLGLIVLSY